MLNKLIDMGVENRLLVVLSLFATLVGSALILPKLNLDAFPDVTNVQVQINTEAQGLAAEARIECAFFRKVIFCQKTEKKQSRLISTPGFMI